jgi:nitrite reductase (NO-forming)
MDPLKGAVLMEKRGFRYEWLAVALGALLLIALVVAPFSLRIVRTDVAADSGESHASVAAADSVFLAASEAGQAAAANAVSASSTRVAVRSAQVAADHAAHGVTAANEPVTEVSADSTGAAAAPVEVAASAAQTDTTAAEGSTEGATQEVAEQNVVEFTLRTQLGGDPAMAYVGVGGDIDGVVNPELVANVGDLVRITLVNGDPTLHDLVIDEFGVATPQLTQLDETFVVEFVADKPGTFTYYCNVPGHRLVGMFGTLRIEGEALAADYGAGDAGNMAAAPAVAPVELANPDAVSIIRNPADVPAPIGDREATTVRFELDTVEVSGVLGDGSTYTYMTFDGQVPGPMLRVREGDTVEMVMRNAITSTFTHSIDLHAVTGPGGGAVNTQTLPGEENAFTFKALQPGLYVYHCATASVAHHITSGMYGLILVEPAGGLEPVDHEFYIMQGEMYTEQPFGTAGDLTFDYDAMLDEQPEYFVFNGAAGALAQDDSALRAEVGDSVRIFFGVGGPNFISSFHVIGEIFERVYDQASLTSPPLTDVQTTLVPPGGATMVEFAVEVPGRYILVDHALSRMERGLAGYLYVEGDENPDVFHSESAEDMSGH